MKYEVDKIHPRDWEQLSENAHLIAFETHKPKEWDRIDFALIVNSSDGELCAYATCREHDHETLYWQYGGTFLGAGVSSMKFPAYRAVAEYCQGRYERITTLIENDNFTCLKFAMKVGFKIVGVRVFKGKVLLEHLWEK